MEESDAARVSPVACLASITWPRAIYLHIRVGQYHNADCEVFLSRAAASNFLCTKNIMQEYFY